MSRKYKIGLYEKALPPELDWKEKFLIAKEANFDYIELSIDESAEKLSRLEWNDDKIMNLSVIAAELSMSFGSICLSAQRKYPLGGEDEEKSLAIMKKVLHFACIAGIPVIQLAGYDVYYSKSTNETRLRFIRNLVKATEMAASEGVLLGFETMETPFMDTVTKSMKYITQINSPYLNIYPDIGNLNNAALLYKCDILHDIETGSGHFLAVHIKETVPGKYREIPFGTGKVDFPYLLGKFWELGVRRYVTELWYTGNRDWKDCIKAANSLATEILDNLEKIKT